MEDAQLMMAEMTEILNDEGYYSFNRNSYKDCIFMAKNN